jgi:hypothetical protein
VDFPKSIISLLLGEVQCSFDGHFFSHGLSGAADSVQDHKVLPGNEIPAKMWIGWRVILLVTPFFLSTGISWQGTTGTDFQEAQQASPDHAH